MTSAVFTSALEVPVDATVTLVKNGQHERTTHLYGRFNNQTRPITDPNEAEKFKLQIWG